MQKSKEITVHSIADTSIGMEEARARLCAQEQHAVDTVNWPEFSYLPGVTVAVGYGNKDIYVHFDVQEKAVLALNTETNASVCQDSCVEMFFAPSPGCYFNFEFNCIGTALVGRGAGRRNRELLETGAVQSIRRESSLGTGPFPERHQETHWWLTAAAALALMGLNGKGLEGQAFRANFYKCGDRLSTPHYLSWNPIDSPAPDFHRPECFGCLRFA